MESSGDSTMTENIDVNRDELPFVAPCRKLSPWAPFRWLRLGIRDLVQAPQHSMAYGLTVALLIGIVSLLAWFKGGQWIMYAMLGGFVFLAPLTCIGLYAISAQLERGQAPQMIRSARAAWKRHFGNEMIFALALLVIFLVWARAAIMVSVPPCAPGKPPETGVSIRWTPVPSIAAPISRASRGLIVADRITAPPFGIVVQSPCSPRMTSFA